MSNMGIYTKVAEELTRKPVIYKDRDFAIINAHLNQLKTFMVLFSSSKSRVISIKELDGFEDNKQLQMIFEDDLRYFNQIIDKMVRTSKDLSKHLEKCRSNV